MSLAIACWVRDTALTENEKDMAYKKGYARWSYENHHNHEYSNKGQKFYKETFNEKHEEEIKKTKEFFWIYKG